MYPSIPSRRKAMGVAVLLTLALLAGGGCKVPGAIMYKVMGPPPIPPKYAPPKEPLLVLVENVHSHSSALPEADELARVVYDDLKEHNVAPLVDPAMVHDLRDQDPKAFGKMSISDVGRKLGAKKILYVQVSDLHLENPPGSDMVRVKIEAKVKVVDVASAQTVWPDSGESEKYDHESHLERIMPDMTRSAMSRTALRESGVQIGRWFYPYQPETMMEENQDVKLR